MLGAERYGTLVLLQLLVGYLAVADLGMGTASTRYAATMHARRDDHAENRAIWTSLVLVALPGAALIAILFPITELLVDLLSLPAELRPEMTAAMRLALALLVLRNVSAVLSAPQFARLRLDLTTLITSGSAVLQIALVPVALALIQRTIDTALAVMVGAGLVGVLAHFAVSRRLLPQLGAPSFDRSLVVPLARFGGVTVGVVFLGMLVFHAEKIWLSQVAGVRALAHYSVAFTIARLTAIVPAATSQPLLPALSRLHAGADFGALATLYGRAVRLFFVVLAPLALFLAVIGRPFLEVWAGPEFAEAGSLPLAILLVGVVVDGISYAPRIFLSAIGRPERILRYQLYTVGPYLVGAGALCIALGPVGAAMAWTARATAEAALLLRSASSELARLGQSPRVSARAIAIAVAILLVPYSVAVTTQAPVTAGAIGAVALLGYAVVAYRSLLTSEERDRLWMMMSKLARRPRRSH